MSLGKNIQRLREALGISQSVLAQRANVKIDSLRNWEQDRATPRIDAALRLAFVLGVTVEELAEEAPVGEETPAKKGRGRKGK
jgi:transcriptional regulator with XRE-family HTH domain